MTYDVQIGSTIFRGLSYAELISQPLEPETFVRRNSSDWMPAKDCVELTHILNQRPSISAPQTERIPSIIVPPIRESDFFSAHSSPISSQPYYTQHQDNEDTYENEDDEEEEDNECSPHEIDDEVEDRIFIPTAEYFKCRQKRKAAIIGVCTLGLAGLTIVGVGNTWRSNIFAGTSFSASAGMGFVFKCLSFFLLTCLTAIPYFIYSVFALIYYSIRLRNLKH